MTVAAHRLAFDGRHIGRMHIAFVRGMLQHPDLVKWWHQYLWIEGPFQRSYAERFHAWLLAQLVAIARAHGRETQAEILERDLSQAAPLAAPSLEEFAQQYPPGFYTERELSDLWKEAYGTLGARGALIEEQLEALHSIESVAVFAPRPADPLSNWFEARLAARLANAGISTLSELVLQINGRGPHWWRRIRGVGQIAARRVEAWLSEHQNELRMVLGPEATTPARLRGTANFQDNLPQGTAVLPIERFLVPPEMDGRNGRFRAPVELCTLEAQNDHQAVHVWYASQRSACTQRAYRKEAERFMLWAILVLNKPLSSVTLEDCLRYRAFLEDPQPSATWCSQRVHPRWSPLWRPFQGPLGATSQRQAITILRGLYQWLMDHHYLVANPWKGVKVERIAGPAIDVDRAFTRKQWAFIESRADQDTRDHAALRLRLALKLAYATGLRLSELVNAKVGDLRLVPMEPEERISDDAFDDTQDEEWVLQVLGKGNKLREVPIHASVLQALSDYLEARGLDPDPTRVAPHTFLLGRIPGTDRQPGSKTPYDPHQGIQANALHAQLKAFFFECALVRARSHKKDGERFRRASAHWLRHTFGSHAVHAGVSLRAVQDFLGHASIATTGIYVNKERSDRIREHNRFMNRQRTEQERRRAMGPGR